MPEEDFFRACQFIFQRDSGDPAKDCQDGPVKSLLFKTGNRGLGIPDITEESGMQAGLKDLPISVIKDTVVRLQQEKREPMAYLMPKINNPP